MRNLKRIIFITFVIGICASHYALAVDEVAADLPNFHEVIPQALYRGGQPTNMGLQTLAEQFHIKVIIDLRNEDSSRLKSETLFAKTLGINVLSFPMSALVKPSDIKINNIEGLLETASPNQSIYVHCLHGEDRTGIVMGLFRVLVQKEDPRAAYAEMLSDGFHPFYFELRRYFCERTGHCP